MAAGRWSRLLGVAGVMLLWSACLVSPMDEEYVSLSVAVDTPPSALTGGGGNSPWDTLGIFHLGQVFSNNEFPKLVRVTVGAAGKKTMAGTWPDPNKELGKGEAASGEVEVSLTVPSGPDYKVSAVAWLLTAAGLNTYIQNKVGSVDLVAGKETDLILNLVAHETGSMEGAVRCKSGNTGMWTPYSVGLVDAEAQALYPPSLLIKDPYLGTHSLSVKGIPVGRANWLRVYLRNSVQQQKSLDVRAPTYAVKKAGDKVLVNLQIPCSF